MAYVSTIRLHHSGKGVTNPSPLHLRRQCVTVSWEVQGVRVHEEAEECVKRGYGDICVALLTVAIGMTDSKVELLRFLRSGKGRYEIPDRRVSLREALCISEAIGFRGEVDEELQRLYAYVERCRVQKRALEEALNRLHIPKSDGGWDE